jgi:hypothetical protein
MAFADLTLVSGSIGTIGTATLASDPGTGTTLTLTTGQGGNIPTVLSGQEIWIQCENELIRCWGHAAGSTTLSVTRGRDGTTNVAHPALTPIYVVHSAPAERHFVPGVTRSPRQNKLLGWTGDPDGANTGINFTAGVMGVSRMYFQADQVTITDLLYFVNSAGVNGAATLANVYVGLYSKSGTLLAVSADQSSAVTSAGAKVAPLTVEAGQSLTQTIGQDDYLWAALLVGTQSSTPFHVARLGAADTRVGNLGLVPTDPYMSGYTGSGLTALPDTFTPTTLGSYHKIVFGAR